MKANCAALLLVAALVSASMWFYVDRIMVGHQGEDAALHSRPRGNLSDLYPRWLGAKELLLHRKNPYSGEITQDIQKGYYGRALDPAIATDPKDQQGFAYPVYVVFLLAPSVGFPFPAVRSCFFWFLLLIGAGSVWLWLRALRWSVAIPVTAAFILLSAGSIPAVQGIKLQQISLLVAGLLAGASACVGGGFLFLGGALLALATIKPQLAWPLCAWLLLWSLVRWRERRNFVFGFGLVMLLLLAGAEIVLPGWVRMFLQAIRDYQRYTQSRSVLDELLPWVFAGKIAAGCAALATIVSLWRMRFSDATTQEFGFAIALVMALTVLVVPMYAPYNQVLLLPAIFVLVRDRSWLFSKPGAMRFIYFVGAFALSWQWIGSLGLSVLYFFSRPLALDAWKLPFYATFAIPPLVFVLTLVRSRSQAVAVPKIHE
jgi:hypothetical protein